eukprot:comp25597_c0_seq1/m.61617 comp25597_c0_seq1/g.61617  ORF comp25597_c0_seq1/g.61617 comp25597_c0_seq1/m.61617 type:complete len:174 (-) comp25597_c0_seq1:1056-1577(-)
MFTWAWAPQGWAICNGVQLTIQQNPALNALLGQTFGGNGTTTFALPNLSGRTPIHVGQGQDGVYYQPGNTGGAENVVLTAASIPQHTHEVNVLNGTKGNSAVPKSALPATVGLPNNSTNVAVNIYAQPGTGNAILLNPATFSTVGGSAGHNNMQPFLVMNFCIATTGIFPPRQ